MAGRHTRWPDGGDPASRPGGPAKKPRREAGRGWLEWRGKGGGAGTLRLLCFNVLAQSLLHKHSFLYNEGGKSGSKSWWLNWKARLKLIRSLLSAQAPDVVLLQEVDGAPALEEIKLPGYRGVFHPRTGRLDGCGVLWRESRVELVREAKLSYSNAGLNSNVAIVCTFRTLDELAREFQVANTHLLFNERRGDVKLGQIRTLLAHLADHRDLPTIVAGDLNALPQSALLRFLTTGALDLATVPDRTHVSGQARGGGRPPSGRWDPEHLALATGDAEETVLRHALDLRCAYGAVFGHQLVQHLPFSTCHRDAVVTVDHICSTPSIKPLRCLVPTRRAVRLAQKYGLPGIEWPSDHFALGIDFNL